ncbi:MAG: hypothetical protein ACJAZN_003347, partial [Planctomycetota bacterium]
ALGEARDPLKFHGPGTIQRSTRDRIPFTSLTDANSDALQNATAIRSAELHTAHGTSGR